MLASLCLSIPEGFVPGNKTKLRVNLSKMKNLFFFFTITLEMFGVLSICKYIFFHFFLFLFFNFVYVLAYSLRLVHAWVCHTWKLLARCKKKKGEEEEEKKRKKLKWAIARGDFNLTMSWKIVSTFTEHWEQQQRAPCRPGPHRANKLLFQPCLDGL